MKAANLMKIKNQMKALYIGLLSVLFTLTGCDKVNQSAVFTEGVIYCSEGAPTTFNPQLVTSGTTIDATSKQLYNRLIDFDNTNFKKLPSLAKTWHVTDDGLKLTFYLRKNIEFHHTSYFTPTRKMNADDVIFSFNRILQPDNPFYISVLGNFPFFNGVKFAEVVKEIEKIDDYTIRFILNRPDSAFLANIAAPFSVILSKEYSEQLLSYNDPSKLEDLDMLPIGTGPYKFSSFRNNSVLRYLKHQDYWRNDVNIEQLIYHISPSNTGRLTKLLTHECDVISYPIAPEVIIERDDLVLEEVTSFNVAFLAFNTQRPPFDNYLVRKALAHAINRQAIISAVYFDQAEIADSLIPKASWGFTDSIPRLPYDVEKAKALLNDAGLSDGFSFDLWAMPLQRPYNPNALKMAKLIKSDLKQIGIEANIVTYEWTTFLRKLENSEHQTVLIGWSADHPDPDNFLSPLLSCSSIATGRNRAFWCDPSFDNLLNLALRTNDTQQRREYYVQAQQILADNIPLFPLAHSKRYQAKQARITGSILTPFGGISFEDVKKEVNKN